MDRIAIARISVISFCFFTAISLGVAVYRGMHTGRLSFLATTDVQADDPEVFRVKLMIYLALAIVAAAASLFLVGRLLYRILTGKPVWSEAETAQLAEILERGFGSKSKD